MNNIPGAVYKNVQFGKPLEQLRLLQILSVEPTIECGLTLSSLRHDTPFTALSYTWVNALHPDQPATSGSTQEGTFTIKVNGKRCRILENLYDALKAFGTDPGQYLWVDAICINQQDVREKTFQVQLMSTIYTDAAQVIVWLGKSDTYTQDAVELIEHLGLLESSERRRIHFASLETREIIDLLDDEFHRTKYWVALAKFFRRTWFTRAWVVQEVILAKPESLVVRCGDHTIAWRSLRHVSGWLSQSAWTTTFADPTFVGDSLLPPRLSAAAKIGSTLDDIDNMSKKSFKGEPHDVFLDTLIRVRDFDSERRRDKAYCCYGIGERYRLRSFPLPVPDYSDSITDAQAFTQTARAVLQMSQSLHLLAYAESERTVDLDGRTTMPSWAPDWSVPKKVGLGITGYKRFYAAGNLMQIVEFTGPDNIILRLRAAKVDEVAALGNTKEEMARGDNLDATYALLHRLQDHGGIGHDTQSREEVLWRTLIHDTCPGSTCPASEKVRHGLRPWLSARPGRGGQAIMDLLDQLAPTRDGASTQDVPEDPTRLDEHAAEISAFATNYALRTCLKLFQTSTGLLGMGAEAIEPGDSVWIIPGSRVPLILRKPLDPSYQGPDDFRLVGAAYIHGLMHGQALDSQPPPNCSRTINIH
ncbi:hypothetical protein LTR78_010205 [Recurvomyces mirabilis]|uniref:Heterokaryon incompatibility domain-containing protein n=1 Tax=Recurvomyces mirabilis TaxID=574656 RepID=A0AAE0WGA1_9PEZI|nr:hypothetical protein LTR78_010205 [Recurvomyces mirabilis]KAK5149671.1 hypothetical protein LTS14_010732 [Recurvomyces mirabilis]